MSFKQVADVGCLLYMSKRAYRQAIVEFLVEEANKRKSGDLFRLRDLAQDSGDTEDYWREFYNYWYTTDASVVLLIGRQFQKHPDLISEFKEYDPRPGDGAAVYIKP